MRNDSHARNIVECLELVILSLQLGEFLITFGTFGVVCWRFGLLRAASNIIRRRRPQILQLLVLLLEALDLLSLFVQLNLVVVDLFFNLLKFLVLRLYLCLQLDQVGVFVHELLSHLRVLLPHFLHSGLHFFVAPAQLVHLCFLIELTNSLHQLLLNLLLHGRVLLFESFRELTLILKVELKLACLLGCLLVLVE